MSKCETKQKQKYEEKFLKKPEKRYRRLKARMIATFSSKSMKADEQSEIKCEKRKTTSA